MTRASALLAVSCCALTACGSGHSSQAADTQPKATAPPAVLDPHAARV